ncbi:hypothetical protein BLNAU_13154 [Blattamonas nauphoetae]|uniref:Uncharacterized protein n=1 Tax=Blattamonas nauphoetae TaxID=2049346 RepID=A0ABQ9XKK1_9EUKA|nr:hypothetical protein BLNAU_13154 [Blattamonas nauphoetae]
MQLLETSTDPVILSFIPIQLKKSLVPYDHSLNFLTTISDATFTQMKISLTNAIQRTDISPQSIRNIAYCLSELIIQSLEISAEQPNRSWPEILPILGEWCKSTSPLLREGVLVIFSEILVDCPEGIESLFDPILSITREALSDRTSARTFSFYLSNRLYDDCVTILERFSKIQDANPSFFANILDELLQGLISIISNPNITFTTAYTSDLTLNHTYPIDLRKIALGFVAGTLSPNKTHIQKLNGFDDLFIRTVLLFMMEFDEVDEDQAYHPVNEEDTTDIKSCCQSALIKYCSAVSATTAKKTIFPMIGMILTTEKLNWKAYYCAMIGLASCIESLASSMSTSDIASMFQLVFPIITGYESEFPNFVSFTGHTLETRDFPNIFSLQRQMEAFVALLGECLAYIDWDKLSRFRVDLIGVFLLGLSKNGPSPRVTDECISSLQLLFQEIRISELTDFIPLLVDSLTTVIADSQQRQYGIILAKSASDALAQLFIKAKDLMDPYLERLVPAFLSYLSVDATGEDEQGFQGSIVTSLTALLSSSSTGAVHHYLDSFADHIWELARRINIVQQEGASVTANKSVDPRVEDLSIAWVKIASLLKDNFRRFLPALIPPLVDTAMKFPAHEYRLFSEHSSDNTDLLTIPSTDNTQMVISENALSDRQSALTLLTSYASTLQHSFIDYVPLCYTVVLNVMREALGFTGIINQPVFGTAVLEETNENVDEGKKTHLRQSLTPFVDALHMVPELVDCLVDHIALSSGRQTQTILAHTPKELADQFGVINPIDIIDTVLLLLNGVLSQKNIADGEDVAESLQCVAEMLKNLTPFSGSNHCFPPSVRLADPWPEDQTKFALHTVIDPRPYAVFLRRRLEMNLLNRHGLIKERYDTDEPDGDEDNSFKDELAHLENVMTQISAVSETIFGLIGHRFSPVFEEELLPLCLQMIGSERIVIPVGEKRAGLIPNETDHLDAMNMLIDYFHFSADSSLQIGQDLIPHFIMNGDAWMESFNEMLEGAKRELDKKDRDDRAAIVECLKSDYCEHKNKAMFDKLVTDAPFELKELYEDLRLVCLQNIVYGIRLFIETDLDWMVFQLKTNSISPASLAASVASSILSPTSPLETSPLSNGVAVPCSYFSSKFNDVKAFADRAAIFVQTLSTQQYDDEDDIQLIGANIASLMVCLMKWNETVSMNLQLLIQNGEEHYYSLVSQHPSPAPFSSLPVVLHTLFDVTQQAKQKFIGFLPVQQDADEAVFCHRTFVSLLEDQQDPQVAGLGFGEAVGQSVLAFLLHGQAPTEEAAPAITKMLMIVLTIVKSDYVDQETTDKLVDIGKKLMGVVPDAVKKEAFFSFDSDRQTLLLTLFSG